MGKFSDSSKQLQKTNPLPASNKEDELMSFNIIIDVDECDAGLNDCHDKAQCINTVGNFSCECSEGYVGDGKLCGGK